MERAGPQNWGKGKCLGPRGGESGAAGLQTSSEAKGGFGHCCPGTGLRREVNPRTGKRGLEAVGRKA